MKRAKWMLALALMVLPGLAAAQLNSSQKIMAQVPFEFVVANKPVPAGEYTIQPSVFEGSTLLIRNTRASVSLFSAQMPSEDKTPAGSYALVFKVYGSQHFLWKIKVKGSRVTCRLPESKAEAELRAQNLPATEEVLLASLK